MNPDDVYIDDIRPTYAPDSSMNLTIIARIFLGHTPTIQTRARLVEVIWPHVRAHVVLLAGDREYLEKLHEQSFQVKAGKKNTVIKFTFALGRVEIKSRILMQFKWKSKETLHALKA